MENKVYETNSYNQEWYLDLDKSWEAIHYLLSGKSVAETEMDDSQPTLLEVVLFNNQLVDEGQDLGYGPAFYLTSEQVLEIDEELQKLDLAALDSKYDGSEMNERGIYPEIWDESESKSFVLDSLNELIAFYKSAADKNECIIMFIS